MYQDLMIDRVCWNITSLCNDDCPFCFRMRDIESLDLEDAINVIQILADNGIKHIAISGGEALLYKHIFLVMEKIKAVGIELTLISNGILLTGEKLYKVLKLVDWIALPLDTLMPYSKQYTRNEKHCDNIFRILEAIEQNSQVKVKINTVVSTVNYLEIQAIYENIIKRYDCIRRWNLFEFTALRGSSKKHSERFELSFVEDATVTNQLKQLKPINHQLRIKYKHKDVLTQSYIVIAPDGSIVKEDLYETEIIGNVLYDDFRDVIQKLGINYKLYKKRTSDAWIEIV